MTILAIAIVLLGAAVAPAATVVLVRSPRPTPEAAEATIRLRGELVSAGFDVRVIDPLLDRDVRASLEQAAAGPDVEAVVAILSDTAGVGAQDSAELWVIDRVTGKTVVRRVPNQPGSPRGAEVLSIRALELLRASFLEVALAAGRAPKIAARSPPPEVTRWTDTALQDALKNRFPSTWAVEAGGCVFGSFEGIGPSVMPLVRVQRALNETFLARITVAGLGTSAHVQNAVATAEVTHQFALAEVAAHFRTDKSIQPMLSLGVGVLRAAASGQNSTTLLYEGDSNDRWALLGDAGVGLHWTFRGRFELALELHAQVANPYPVIRVVHDDIAREGRPTVITSLTLIAWM